MLRSRSIDDEFTDLEHRKSIVDGDGSEIFLAGTNCCRISDENH